MRPILLSMLLLVGLGADALAKPASASVESSEHERLHLRAVVEEQLRRAGQVAKSHLENPTPSAINRQREHMALAERIAQADAMLKMDGSLADLLRARHLTNEIEHSLRRLETSEEFIEILSPKRPSRRLGSP
jgi:hypothetical protein